MEAILSAKNLRLSSVVASHPAARSGQRSGALTREFSSISWNKDIMMSTVAVILGLVLGSP